MTGNEIHIAHAEWVNRAKAADTRMFLEHEYARLRETGFSQTKLYSRLVRDAVQSQNAYVKDALHDHLRQRDDFSPKMPTADFIKKADRFGFETLGLFKSIVEGHVLVLARSADAQIMLANIKDRVVIEVELHRFFTKDGSAPEFNAKCFGEDDHRMVKDVMLMTFATTPALLGAMVEHDLNSRHLATDWRSGRQLVHRGLLMGFEAASLDKDRAGASKVRADSVIGRWRDIFALDRERNEPADVAAPFAECRR
ncbi:hypothetical protein OIU34_19805 [Pararhizobium sp. BT-229]|uniref:hypothetical protein n=1 Tax=Pararhizobium sp. BT-229 TaxID=2986923 RepID=UPI0021F7C80E|nr:hypothetical protein [Pararhizobium sp. BT-229]MCV9964131.1 hypothetical protein [Pararhizobium sp. BT-229]